MQNNQEPPAHTPIPKQIQLPNDSEEAEKFPPIEVPNFYQTGRLPSSNPNKGDSITSLNPHSSSEEKYVEVKSLVYENTVGIVGKEKGSGKTLKLGYLIAEHIKVGHLVWMVNPFAKGQQAKKTQPEESSSSPTDTEQFRQKLIQQEDIWGHDGDKNN